ncbi:hypothetical protein [Micromonospora sp. NPDC049679]|uniref:hypothetical protein n=1 Tax=Micromonospora sp. NPDC049679 TaxID=3155920 RepID=UPI0033C5A29B
MDVGRDMVRAAEALQAVLDFLIRYDQAHAMLNGDEKATGLSPLTLRVDDGLRAANRVLTHLRSVDESIGSDHPSYEVAGLPETAQFALSHPPLPSQDDHAQVGPRRRGHGDPGE